MGFSCNNKDHDGFRGNLFKSYKDIHEISKIIGTDSSILNQFLIDGVSNRYLINLSQGSTLPAPSSEIGSFGAGKDQNSPNLKTRRDCEYDFYLKKIDFRI